MSIMVVESKTGNAEPLESTNNKLDVNVSIPASDAAKNGDFYSWTANYNSGDDDHVIFIRNTNPTKDLHILSASISVKLATVVSLNRVTGSGTGSSATEVNWLFSSPNVANVVALEDAGDTGTDTIMQCFRLPNEGDAEFELYGSLVLTNGDDGVSITTSKGSQDMCAIVIGYFL